jgi:hypothetical protein
MRKSVLRAVSFKAAPDPNLIPELPPEREEMVDEQTTQLDRSIFQVIRKWSVPILIASLLIYLTQRTIRRHAPHFQSWRAQKKRESAESEATIFRQLKKACVANDKSLAYKLLISWIERLHSGRTAVKDFIVSANDEKLAVQYEQLDRSLFAKDVDNVSNEDSWSGSDFYRSVARARKKIRHRRGHGHISQLPMLNPQ